MDFNEKSGAFWPAKIVVIFPVEPTQRESRRIIDMGKSNASSVP
jgi:hypothetical protein